MRQVHFIHAAAVIEYECINPDELPRIYHVSGPPSEHFEQLMLDFERLFIPVDNPFPSGLPFRVAPSEVVEIVADVQLACDKERGIAWGKIRDVELINRQSL